MKFQNIAIGGLLFIGVYFCIAMYDNSTPSIDGILHLMLLPLSKEQYKLSIPLFSLPKINTVNIGFCDYG